jgi:hypothetical protein
MARASTKHVASFTLGTLMLMGIPCTVGAQDNGNCTALLQHGIYDTFRQTSGNVSSTQYKFDLCQAYNRLQTDKKAASISAHYALAGGEASYSSDQLDQIGQTMCTSTTSNTYSQTDLNVMQQVIDQAGVDAYTQCVKLNSAGLKTNTVIRESDAAQMTLDMYYVAPIGAVAQVAVKKIDVSPANSFLCTGPLWDMAGSTKDKMDTHSYSMSCSRTVASTPVAGGKVLAPASTVTVMTDVGSVSRSFVPIVTSPPPPPFDIPIGTIIPFTGSRQDAEAQQANGWWICDGRTVNETRSAAFNGKPTPNLSDRFLVGSGQAGSQGGAPSFPIASQTIESHTIGFGEPQLNNDPFTHMQGSHTWTTDASIHSQGTWNGITVPTVPPYYTVIYLVRVR